MRERVIVRGGKKLCVHTLRNYILESNMKICIIYMEQTMCIMNFYELFKILYLKYYKYTILNHNKLKIKLFLKMILNL